MATLYPTGYGRELVPMVELRRRFEPHMEPEFARRVFPWIESKGGQIGIGSGRRLIQPVKPGFAPPGQSFHEDQRYHDGSVWYSALDLVARNGSKVHRAPGKSECPQQGSAEAAVFGVHINTYETWHIQPVPQDGHGSWVKAGRPRPVAGYPIPGPSFVEWAPAEQDPQEDEDMALSDEDIEKIAKKVWEYSLPGRGDFPPAAAQDYLVDVRRYMVLKPDAV